MKTSFYLFSLVLIPFLILASLHPWATAQPPNAYISVPYHPQENGYYCGPASLEMIFDFYGPDVPQIEIADVAKTTVAGTYASEMIRAAHFSNMSTSEGNESPLNFTGYTARKRGYAALDYAGMTIDELKSVIAAGYPIIVLTTWHFRVAVGYSSTHITFQDPLYGSKFNMTYQDFDEDWDYSGHWALFVSPWNASVSNPRNLFPGDIFNVTATITYPWTPPFQMYQYPASAVNATITLPEGLTLASNETARKTISSGELTPGESTNVTWTVQAENEGGYVILVEAEGLVEGYLYQDRIGGFSQSVVAVTSQPDGTPPTTTDDYNGLWHSQNFRINLTAVDDNSGVMETYYRINNGSVQTVDTDGQPHITTANVNNTLEYWSEDWAGNEETPHTIVSGIKLDKTPPRGSIVINNGAIYTNSSVVTLKLSAVDDVSGVVAQMRFSNDSLEWSPWESYNTSKTLELTPTDGSKTVYAQLMDNAQLISNKYKDDIVLDLTPPTIGTPSRVPSGDVLPNQEVKVSVNVTDATSHVKSVFLSYNPNNSDMWIDLPMTLNSTTGVYEAVIPQQDAFTLVKYMIVAYDNAENSNIENNNGWHYNYPVIPEISFLPLAFLLLSLFATLFRKLRDTLSISRRRHKNF